MRRHGTAALSLAPEPRGAGARPPRNEWRARGPRARQLQG
jgi:hypothetical protein